MNLIDDAELAQSFYLSEKRPRVKQNFAPGNLTASTVADALAGYFPLKVFNAERQSIDAKASLFEYESKDGQWVQAGLGGYARRTEGGFWVLLSATMIERLRWLSLRLLENAAFRKAAAIDQLVYNFRREGYDFVAEASELIVAAGLEFLLFHELGHIMSGHCPLPNLGRQSRQYGLPALELEADLFAAIRMAESCLTSRLQILPSRRIWQNKPNHYFSALALMGVFSTFGLLAVENQTDGTLYPPFKVRFHGFCIEFMLTYGERGRTTLSALGLVRFASSGIPIVLDELGVPSSQQAIINQFSVYKGSYFDHITSEVETFMSEAHAAVAPYQEALNQIRPIYAGARNRRVRHEVWDAAW